MSETTVAEIINTVLSQPQTAVVMGIQFFLGLALGYVSVKALRYIIAFIAILALGTFLSIWSLGSTPQEALQTLQLSVGALKNLAAVIGLMSVGPVSVGYIIGAVIALMRK